MGDKLHELTVHELSGLIRTKKVSAKEVARSFIDRVNAVEERVKAYVTVTSEIALKQAEEVDKAIARGEEMPLTGLAEAARTHEVIFAADRSWQEKRPVKLAEIVGCS